MVPETESLAPKQDLEVLKTKEGLGFRVCGKLFEDISKWEYSLDETIFKEQLKTGMFFRSQLGEYRLAIMKQAEKEGRICPYYGVSNTSVAVYYFMPKPDSFTVKVEHLVTKEYFETDIPIEDVLVFIDREISPKSEYSATPSWFDGKRPASGNEIIFRITENEYQNLLEWRYWVDNQAFSPKYIYRFGLVTLGPGFTMEVEDTETGNTIDVTYYENW